MCEIPHSLEIKQPCLEGKASKEKQNVASLLSYSLSHLRNG